MFDVDGAHSEIVDWCDCGDVFDNQPQADAHKAVCQDNNHFDVEPTSRAT